MMAELGKRGLLYLDDGSSARSVAPEMALKNGVPFAAGDTAIDAVRDRRDPEEARPAGADRPRQGLRDRHRLGLRRDGRCRRRLGQRAKKRGIEIVPVSAVATDPERG